MKKPADQLTDSQRQRVEHWLRKLSPKVLPAGWAVTADYVNCVVFRAGSMGAILEVEVIDDQLWAHMSISHPGRLPSWDELRAAKDLLIGRERKAIQVLPPEAEYVNIHPNVLHLYSPLEVDPLPDFRAECGGI